MPISDAAVETITRALSAFGLLGVEFHQPSQQIGAVNLTNPLSNT